MFNNPYHGIRRPMAPGPNPPRRRFRMPASAMPGLGLYERQETMGTFGVPGEAEGDTRPTSDVDQKLTELSAKQDELMNVLVTQNQELKRRIDELSGAFEALATGLKQALDESTMVDRGLLDPTMYNPGA